MADHKSGEVCQPGHTIGGIEYRVTPLTDRQRERRHDWAVATAELHNPSWGTSGGHTIHHYARRHALSVEPARGAILNPATKDAILEAYHRTCPDRYLEEREAYGIWHVATCAPGEYMIHRTRVTEKCKHCGHVRRYGDDHEYGTCDSRCTFEPHEMINTYERIAASALGEALAIAERKDGGRTSYSYGIMAADYDAARAEGISFFEGDGLLI